ncbi:MAG: Sua5/YciO/YrdC/YwlC family protein, partial [Paramuribaculum sp.]|nr:Sua5/YciO/YrdC/YwlC family protein [Paramuribaculum sp.]
QTVSINQDFRQDVSECVEVMSRGGVVVYPTDTVWGIGCDARNSSAVRRVFEIKRRAESKALISLVADIAMLRECVSDIPLAVTDLIKNTGTPLTVVYDHPSGLAPELLAQDGSAALRITSERYSQELCRLLGAPVVSTSANIAGNPTPLSFEMIDPYILDSADYVSRYGRDFAQAAGASRVIKVSADGQIKIIRP